MTTGELLGPGEAAQRTGLSLDALRYHEREGPVGPVRRSAAGQRLYDADDLAWIGIVTCLRQAGLGIADLRHFTELLRTDAGALDRVAFLRARRVELQERLKATRRAITVLDDKIDYYGGHPRKPDEHSPGAPDGDEVVTSSRRPP